jgi:uncharacterized protein
MGAPVAFGGWGEAIDELLTLGEDSPHPVPVVLDEFPYLLATVPELPSIIQAALSPRGGRSGAHEPGSSCAARRSRSWKVCSGARRRCGPRLDGLVHPFDHRTAPGR